MRCGHKMAVGAGVPKLTLAVSSDLARLRHPEPDTTTLEGGGRGDRTTYYHYVDRIKLAKVHRLQGKDTQKEIAGQG